MRPRRSPRTFRPGRPHGRGSGPLAVALAAVLSVTTAGFGQPSSRAAGTDRHGDSLPAGAIARLGSARLKHGHAIKHLAFSPDGKTLASSSWDKTLRLWDPATGKEVRRFRMDATLWSQNFAHDFTYFAFSPDGRTVAANQGNHLCLLDTATGEARVRCRGHAEHFAFTPGGKTLVALYGDAVVRWDAGTGKELSAWKHDKAEEYFFHRCAFSPDRQTLAVGDFRAEEPHIHLWDVRSGEKVRAWKAHQNYVRDLAFSPDGKFLVSVSDDATVRLWEAASGKEVRAWHKQSHLYHLAMSPDGKSLALSGIQTLRLVDWTTGKELRSLDSGYGPMAFSGDGRTLAVAEAEHGISLWDVRTGKPSRPTDEIYEVGYSPDGRVLVSRGRPGVQLWDSTTGKPDRQYATDGPMAVSPAGGVLALVRAGTGKADASVTVVELKTGKELRQFPIDRDNTWPIGWSEDGRVLVLGTERPGREWWWSAGSTSARWWDWAAGKEVRRLDGDLVICSPDARTAAVLTHQRPGQIDESNGGRVRRLFGTLRVVDTGTGRELFQLPDCGTVINGELRGMNAFDPLFSADGTVLAAPSADGSAVRLWDVKTGRKLTELRAAEYDMELFCLSPDGKHLVVQDKERAACLLQVSTGRVLHRLNTHCVRGCAFSADGTALATAASEGELSLWEVATGGRVRSWQPAALTIRHLTFSPDGSGLTTLNSDGTALVWDLTGGLRAGRRPAPELSARDPDHVWADLAADDAARADRALWRLAAGADRVVPFLKDRLPQVPPPDAGRVRRLIGDLASDRFADRQKAERELELLGESAGPALEQALADRPAVDLRERLTGLVNRIENRPADGERLRAHRAVRALEYAGTADARRVLEHLARGAAGAQLTRDAKASLQRLARRQPP